MKDDEKKSQQEDTQLPDEEDMDFEILDALEQLDQSSPQESPKTADETIELNLDDDDMDFEGDFSEAGNSFSFDDSLREDLEQELLQGDIGFDIAPSLEDDLVKEIQADAGGDDFALDLDLDKEFSSGEAEAEDTEAAFDMSAAETLAFKFNKQNSEAGLPSLEGDDSDDIGAFDLDLGSEDADLDLDSFSSEDDDFPELDLGVEGVEISEEFADLGKDIDLDVSLDSLEQESEDESIPGKAVIAVGDDEVIDLGDEEQLSQEQPPESPAPMTTPPPFEAEETLSPEAEEEAEDVPPVPEVALDLHEDDDEELMNSLEDIAIDLGGNDTSEDPDASLGEEDVEAISPTENEAVEEDLPSPKNTDMAELVKEVIDEQETETADDEQEAPAPEEEAELPEEDDEPEADAEELAEESIDETPAEEEEEEEVDVREFLELNLRLSDQQIDEFEGMVSEAKTLQTYIDELEEHQSDVKENIYHKLQAEYIARKTVIFKSEEFISLLSDVEQDLEDMLSKRAEFIGTVERLNEELEEIKVRHLVGEYNDSTLAEKQESQNTEIDLWNEKTEKIQLFITRYEESLDAEKALNPLRQEAEEMPKAEEPPQEEEAHELEDASEAPEIPETSDDAPATAEETEEEPAEELAEEPTETLAEEAADLSSEESDASVQESEEDETLEAEAESDIEDFFAASDDDSKEDEELDEEFPMDGEFETGDFVLDDLSGFEDDEEEEEEEDTSADIFDAFASEAGDDGEEEDTIACSKCGRQTPASEKFCVHCGGKAQKAEQNANVSCKKCGRETPAAEKFCIHCGGKAQ